jgi:L-cysteine/cystine lyase
VTTGTNPTPESPNLTSVRAQLPSLAGEVYLNTGGAGPMPIAAAEAIAEAATRSASRGRMSLPAIGALQENMAQLRTAVARLLRTEAARVAITQNTTHAVNVVVSCLDWQPGDEVVTTALEHPGVGAPLFVLAARNGVRVRVIPRGEAHADLAGAVERRSGPRTRLVAVSHVAYATGAVLDVAGAASAARAVGAMTLIDGAQSAGAMPVDPHELGVDAYAIPSQKWLLGPEGLGALWISDAAMERVSLTFASYESGDGHAPGGAFQPHAEARRYELSTPPTDLVAGWVASLAWLEEIGWPEIYRRTRAVTSRARDLLEAVAGVTVLTPVEQHAGLLAFTISGHEPSAVNAALSRRGVSIRPIDHPPCVRSSTGFFSSDDDIQRLATEITMLTG